MVEIIKYLGEGGYLTDQNSIHEEIKGREWLLSFGAVNAVIQFAIQKYRDYPFSHKAHRTLYLKTQSVPRSKHFSSRL